ncbi:hypothetical protein ACIGO9_31325 [Nocardia asteroides]|uniref:hypothetical protein n=1 Tax=Nocardia asteroides TaxID=1824 RepID=UPI0037C6670D
MADKEVFESTFIIGPNGEDRVVVYFEPTGMMHEVAAGDHVRVRVFGPDSGVPEIWHSPSNVVIWGWPGALIEAWDKSGRALEI